ncbi:YjhT family mutarotase [Vibrio sp. TBV020]|uniref:YjhT family mutarotase n=1 Tax=Vibrio sp. TBV020 TaxID=3137398 RepID=UPI0038CD7C4C
MSLLIEDFPPLPCGVKNGVGGVIGNKLYAGLGSAGKRLFFYDLDCPELGWQTAAEFPGVTRNDAVCTVSNDKLYVFSGAGILDGEQAPVVLDDGYLYDPRVNQWSRLETHLPIGLLGASACEFEPGQLLFFGGYCKETFDTFLAAISKIDPESQPEKHRSMLVEFMSRPVEAYGWNQDIWMFDTFQKKWSLVAENIFPANCGAGIVRQNNVVTLIEGEVKPGLRSLDTKRYEFHSSRSLSSLKLPSIQQVEKSHEGLAGHFSGVINEQIIAAGGAYFIGSQSNFLKGQWYSHQGLTKHYNNQVWRFDGNEWHQTTSRLPEGVAYGVSISTNNKMYVIGGEGSKGQALSSCYALTWR